MYLRPSFLGGGVFRLRLRSSSKACTCPQRSGTPSFKESSCVVHSDAVWSVSPSPCFLLAGGVFLQLLLRSSSKAWTCSQRLGIPSFKESLDAANEGDWMSLSSSRCILLILPFRLLFRSSSKAWTCFQRSGTPSFKESFDADREGDELLSMVCCRVLLPVSGKKTFVWICSRCRWNAAAWRSNNNSKRQMKVVWLDEKVETQVG